MPSNEYYDSSGAPSTNSPGTSAPIRAEYDSVEAGFDKLPVLSGNGGLLIRVNAGASGLESRSNSEVRNQLNVYDKTVTYTQTEVDDLIAAIVTVPTGAIVSYVPGHFGNGSNGSYTSGLASAANTVTAANALINGDGWHVCNGAALNVSGSDYFDGASRYLPNLTDDRFIMGDTKVGVVGGSNTMSHIHSTANRTLTISQIPSHDHDINGVFVGSSSTKKYIYLGRDTPITKVPTDNEGGGGAHNHGNTGVASNTVNRPKFLSCFYILKVS